MRAVSGRVGNATATKRLSFMQQRIVTPSVGCSSHPGRAPSLWGTIQNACRVGYSESWFCWCFATWFLSAPPNRSSKRSPFSSIESKRPMPHSFATAKRTPLKRQSRMSALSMNISRHRLKLPRILSGWRRLRACLPVSLTSSALAMARRCRSMPG